MTIDEVLKWLGVPGNREIAVLAGSALWTVGTGIFSAYQYFEKRAETRRSAEQSRRHTQAIESLDTRLRQEQDGRRDDARRADNDKHSWDAERIRLHFDANSLRNELALQGQKLNAAHMEHETGKGQLVKLQADWKSYHADETARLRDYYTKQLQDYAKVIAIGHAQANGPAKVDAPAGRDVNATIASLGAAGGAKAEITSAEVSSQLRDTANVRPLEVVQNSGHPAQKDDSAGLIAPEAAETTLEGHFTETAETERFDLVEEYSDVDTEVIDIAERRLAMSLQEYADTSAPAQMGDRVVLTGQGYVQDGAALAAFPGGKLENFSVVLGSGLFIPGFEEKLVGLKKGATTTIDVVFPGDYHEVSLAGRPARFSLVVNDVRTPRGDPLAPDNLRKLGFNDRAQLRSVLSRSAARDLEVASKQRLKRQLLDKLDAINQHISSPPQLVEKEHAALWRAQLMELKLRNLPMEALGKPEKDARAELRPLAERRVRLGIVMSKLATLAYQTEKYRVTKAAIDKAIEEKIAAAAADERAELTERYKNPVRRQDITGPLLEDAVTRWLLDNSNITRRKVPATDLLSELT